MMTLYDYQLRYLTLNARIDQIEKKLDRDYLCPIDRLNLEQELDEIETALEEVYVRMMELENSLNLETA